jgi:hypothetical protein
MMKKNTPEGKPAKLPVGQGEPTRLRRTVKELTPIIAILEWPHYFRQGHIIL